MNKTKIVLIIISLLLLATSTGCCKGLLPFPIPIIFCEYSAPPNADAPVGAAPVIILPAASPAGLVP